MGNQLSVVSGLPCVSARNPYKDGEMCDILIYGGSCEASNCEAEL